MSDKDWYEKIGIISRWLGKNDLKATVYHLRRHFPHVVLEKKARQ